jgi:hypothetical protein
MAKTTDIPVISFRAPAWLHDDIEQSARKGAAPPSRSRRQGLGGDNQGGGRMNRSCEHCGTKLSSMVRAHARFCSPAHRAAHHRHNPRARRPRVRFLTGATLDKTADPYSYVGIVPDEKRRGMYRLKRTDGSLSDMVNLTRARNALRESEERGINDPPVRAFLAGC